MLRTAILLFALGSSLFAQKRALRHSDYDAWKHIQNQQLSPDGHFLAYAVFPQVGNGEVIVRNLVTGTEIREPAGELPPPPAPNFAVPQTEEAPPPPPGISIKFTPDSSHAVFLSFATHEQVAEAKRAKKKPEEMPKGDLVVVTLSAGQAARTSRVLSFQLPSKTTGKLAWLQGSAETSGSDKPAAPADGEASAARKPVRGELVLHDLRDGSEQKFPGVTEYTLLKDNSWLVFADEGGLNALSIGGGKGPARLLEGKGKYEKLAWDEEETRLALVSDRGDAGDKPAHFKLYTWDKQSSRATEVASEKSSGFPAGWTISDKATLSLSKGGRFVFLGTQPEPAPVRSSDKTPADEKVSVDLWAWNDDFIQPMQKVRANVERNRSYRAVVDVESKRFTQLADTALAEVTPSEDGRFAIGNDDREYRRMQEYDDRFEDTYLVDTANGKRTLLAKKHLGRVSWSPDSQHAVYFDGKDWMLMDARQATVRNLTAAIPVSFGREIYDMPGKPPAEGPAIWTKDGKTVVFYDRYDVWRCQVDASAPVNWTGGFGRAHHVAFRIVRSEREDPADRYLDGTKPVLLRAEDEASRDTGFYRLAEKGAPVKLLMVAQNFAPPIKARNADVYVTAASTFRDYPDLQVTDGSFREFKKVSSVGTQVDNFLWGSAELMHFESADGVKLDGTLYKPANFDAKKKYPLIVYIYERLSQNTNNFVEPKPTNVISPSYYASNGYLVLEPDIAYKTGYPGQSALRCVLPAVQAIVDRGYVDEKAIGIQGHSWGGYQIAYMVTQTNRFRAAAPGAPVANMISAYDGIRWGPGIPRQFQYERTQSRIGGTPWEYPLRYIENSPIFMVDRVKTPLLMIHNDADDAVPWYQGIEYFLALRRLNKEAYLFSYNGEPHNLRRRPNQMDYTLRLQQFFDYYLKGAPKPDWMEHGLPFIHKASAPLPTDAGNSTLP